MPATIVMGGQWGDEGKGKLTDTLAGGAAMVVRANGGANAGHTVESEQGVFKLHLIPSGILRPDCTCIIGAGVVLDPASLVGEMDALLARGVSLDRLWISDRAHLVLPFHPRLDQLEEERRGEAGIGTTLRGIGPAYADKAARLGIRAADLLDQASLRSSLGKALAIKNRLLTLVYGQAALDLDAMHRELIDLGERLRPYIRPTEMMVQDALDAGAHVVVECAQGAMLDIDYGTYPFVTSSSPTAAGACQGAGIAPNQVSRVLGVFKAYGTRVGTGPFPTELFDDTGDTIRERGREYGTTTGRPRRTGWFDAVAARQVVRLNGITDVALTLLDVLDAFAEINVCTAYEFDGATITHVPAPADVLAKMSPVYTTLPGWGESTRLARAAAELPATARAYISFLESAIGAPVSMAGVGPGRDELVAMRDDAGAGLLVPA
ncbi:MAG: adenylosuccinate synthase [Chloroflexota bacterium]|nr:adenylosuccinate synthase [Chloroflexota bacterium]